jgi:hypothetical protein
MVPPGEGAFLPCSFWLADNYTPQNRYAEASALFDRLLSLRNDVGLLLLRHLRCFGKWMFQTS